MTRPCPRCDQPAPTDAQVCPACGVSLLGAHAATVAALRRARRALADPALPPDVARRADVALSARLQTLIDRGPPPSSRPAPAPRPARPVRPAVAAPPAEPPAPQPPTLWQRLGPAFAENLLFVLGAFLLLAGAAYFTSTAWTTMGGGTRLGVVQAGLSALAGLLAGLGWLLNRDGRLDDLEAVLRPVAAAVAAVAVIAAGRLTGLSPVAGALAGVAGVALAGVASGWAGGPRARWPGARFAAAAWAAPWAAGWATPALTGLGVALAFSTRAKGRRASAPVVLAWAVASAHLVVAAGPAWPGLGVALAGAGLAAMLRPGRSAHGLGLALAVGGVPVALADPTAALAAAGLGAAGALRGGLRHERRALWGAGLLLAFTAYLLSPAPLRALVLQIRAALSNQLGYAGGRLPLAWYAVTCLPYLAAVVWSLGPVQRRAPRLLGLTRWWLRLVTVALLGLALSGGELRPLALGWAAVGAVGVALEAWRPDRGLGALSAGALAAAVAWAALWQGLGPAWLAGGWGALAWVAGLLASRWPQTGLRLLSVGSAALAACAALGVSVATTALGPPTVGQGLALAVAVAALLAHGLGPWALVALAGPMLAVSSALPAAASAAAAVAWLASTRARPEAWLGLTLLAGWPHAGWGWAQAALGGVLVVALARLPGWPRALAGALAPATAAAVAHALGAPPPATAVVALLAAALVQAAHRWSPGAAGGATWAAVGALAALVWLDPPPSTLGPLVVGSALVLGALLTGRGARGWLWALAGAAGACLWAVGAHRACAADPGLLGAGLAVAGAGAVALGPRWAAGRPGARLTAALLGLAALGQAAFNTAWSPAALAGALGLGVLSQGVVAGLLVTPATLGLGLWAVERAAAPYPAHEGVLLAAMAGLLALGARGLRGVGPRATLLWSAPLALLAANRAIEAGWQRLEGAQAGPPWLELVVVAVAAFAWQVGERAPAWARRWTRLAAATLALGAWAPITRALAAAPGHLAPPAFELVLLAGACAWAVADPRVTRAALALGLLCLPVAPHHPAAAGLAGLAAAVAGLRAWRAPTAVDVGLAVWLTAGAAFLGCAAVTQRPVSDPALWPALAVVLTAVSVASARSPLARYLPMHGPLSATGAVGAVLAVALGGEALGPLAGLAVLGAGLNGAWQGWRVAAERADAVWAVVGALAATHGAVAQRSGWLAVVDGHHLELWSALALAAVVFAPAGDARGRAARRQALLLVLPAILAADDALGVARGAGLAALVYAVAGRDGRPWLRRLALGFGNLAVWATWVAVGVVDPAFYGLPPGLTLVAVAELDRARLSPRAHLGLLMGGLTLSYGAVAVQALKVASAAHAAGLLGLGLAVVALGWWRKRPGLLLGGAAGVVLAPAGHLLRAGFQRGFSGAVLLSVAGVAVLGAAGLAARRRRE